MNTEEILIDPHSGLRWKLTKIIEGDVVKIKMEPDFKLVITELGLTAFQTKQKES